MNDDRVRYPRYCIRTGDGAHLHDHFARPTPFHALQGLLLKDEPDGEKDARHGRNQYGGENLNPDVEHRQISREYGARVAAEEAIVAKAQRRTCEEDVADERAGHHVDEEQEDREVMAELARSTGAIQLVVKDEQVSLQGHECHEHPVERRRGEVGQVVETTRMLGLNEHVTVPVEVLHVEQIETDCPGRHGEQADDHVVGYVLGNGLAFQTVDEHVDSAGERAALQCCQANQTRAPTIHPHK